MNAIKLLPPLACLSLAVSIACGAFGAHALRNSVSPLDIAIWEKAVLYQMIHSLAVLAIALSRHPALEQRRCFVALNLMLLSILVFSGSLYLLVLLQQRWLGAITPIGGSGFIVAWLSLALCLRPKRD